MKIQSQADGSQAHGFDGIIDTIYHIFNIPVYDCYKKTQTQS